METPMMSLQTGMYTTLTGLGYNVYDYRPVEGEFPYIVIGEDGMASSMTKTIPHYTVVSIVHVFSKYLGNKEIKQIFDDIVAHCNRSMSLSGWQISNFKVITSSILIDTMPDVLHGLITLQFEISKTT